jgi:hypothetical protein
MQHACQCSPTEAPGAINSIESKILLMLKKEEEGEGGGGGGGGNITF